VLVVDALGLAADWDEVVTIARRHGLAVVEDAACAAGGSYRGRPCGSFGDISVFSLHARKGITCGEGGVLVTDDVDLAAVVRSASCFGMTSAYQRQSASQLSIPSFEQLGWNYKLSDVLAAIAVVQLGKLPGLVAARQAVADVYLSMLPDVDGVVGPAVPADRAHAWQTFAVTVADPTQRDEVVMGLRDRGIGSNIGTYALHREPVYGPQRECPVSADAFARHVALPLYAEMDESNAIRVIETLNELLAD
jgi:perosamine synthetase